MNRRNLLGIILAAPFLGLLSPAFGWKHKIEWRKIHITGDYLEGDHISIPYICHGKKKHILIQLFRNPITKDMEHYALTNKIYKSLGPHNCYDFYTKNGLHGLIMIENLNALDFKNIYRVPKHKIKVVERKENDRRRS